MRDSPFFSGALLKKLKKRGESRSLWVNSRPSLSSSPSLLGIRGRDWSPLPDGRGRTGRAPLVGPPGPAGRLPCRRALVGLNHYSGGDKFFDLARFTRLVVRPSAVAGAAAIDRPSASPFFGQGPITRLFGQKTPLVSNWQTQKSALCTILWRKTFVNGEHLCPNIDGNKGSLSFESHSSPPK